MATQASIGAAIYEARKEKKLTRKQLEKLSGVHHSTLFHLEKGRGNASLGNLLAVCDALGLELLVADKQVSRMIQAEGKPEFTQSQLDSQALMANGPGPLPLRSRAKP